MNYEAQSIRTFIGAKDFGESRSFYLELDFIEVPLGPKMSFFKVDEKLGFYLQNAYVKDWIDNSMIFLEVANLEECLKGLKEKNLTEKYKNVRLSGIKTDSWGREFFLHDPSGILWHFGEFTSSKS
ncbi:glyoxalase [Flammeovirgaceae bacterium SG7u.111]|nr:glyoxalase [Flammeovirgaceae bacterium SG7u.132]WPO33319.1 glyoxalase [Flammeovirgaceae bacterium SG7u.111]